MADLRVNVTASKTKSVTVKSNSLQTPISATPDLSLYYSDIAKDYAGKAENSANRAAGSAESANNAANSILNNEDVRAVIENLSIIEAAPANAQIAQEQATIATEQATVSTTQATIATQKAQEASSNAETILEQVDIAKTSAVNANTSAVNANTSANSARGYMDNAEASALAAKNSETSAKTSASEALASKNSASSSATSASTSATTATTKANEAKTSATQAANSATLAQGYAQDALNSKTQAQDIVEQGIEDIQEILENASSGGSIDEVNLVHKDGEETITGAKTFTQPLKIQNGAGTGTLLIGGDVNAGTVTNGTRKLARVAVPTQTNKDLNAILLGFDSNGDDALHIKNSTTDAISFGGQTKITNATSPMSIGFCVAKTRNATSASDKIYPLEMDSTEARFNVQPNYNGDNLVTQTELNNAVVGGSVDAYTKSETDALLDKKQDVLSATAPIEIGSKTVGGPYNITTENGYIVPTYKGFPDSRYTIDTSNSLISIANPNASQPITDINSLFSGNCSYFDVPVDFASRISKVQNGEESFASIALELKGVQTAGNVISFLAGQQTDTEFIPIIFGKAGNTTSAGMLIGTALLTGKVLPYSGGVSLEYDSAGTTGTSYSDSTFGIGANFSFNYNPSSNYPLSINTYSYNATTGYYTRVRKSSVTPELLANLSKINVIRVFWGDTNGGTSVKYFPTVEDTQLKYNYVDTGWRITNGAVTTYGVSLKYDNTLKVNDNGELTANLDVIATSEALEVKQDKLTAGENITIEDNVISAVVPEGGGGAGMPVGTIYPLNCSSSYVPEGSLPTDGAEYSASQFMDLWNNYLGFLGGEVTIAYAYGGYYVKSESPQENDIIYKLVDGVLTETSQYVIGVGDNYIIASPEYIDPEMPPAVVNSYRKPEADIKEGGSLLNTCSYAEYEQELATYGQCAKFAVDFANGIFRVPFIKDGAVIQQAMSNGELGKSYNAGLPNITGSSTINGVQSGKGSGAFVNAGSGDLDDHVGSGGAGLRDGIVTLDASLSNPIYGNSDTVQQNAVALRYFVVVATGSINQSMMDWSQWASSLQGKLNADLSNINVNQALKNEIVSWGMPDYTAGVTKTKGETYTETIDGFIVLNIMGTSSTNKLTIAGYEHILTTQSSGSHGVSATFPVPKGTEYTYTGANPKQYMFFPLKGAN